MTTWTHMGNVQKFAVTPTPTVVKHKNTQGGLKRIDLTAMTLVEMGFTAQLDEWTIDNLLMALLGTDTGNTAGAIISVGTNVVQRQIKFVGANLYGPNYTVIMPSVFINAKDAIEFLGSDDFASLPLSGDVLYDTGIAAFATVMRTAGGNVLVTPDELNYYLGTGSMYTAPLGT